MEKIIQILKTENNVTWQDALLGLSDEGVVYILDTANGWVVYEPALDTRCQKAQST